METFSASLALCAGNSPVTSEFPSQRPVTHSFDVFFDLRLNKRLSKKNSETGDLRRHRAHYDVNVMKLFLGYNKCKSPTQTLLFTLHIDQLYVHRNVLSKLDHHIYIAATANSTTKLPDRESRPGASFITRDYLNQQQV